MVAAWIERMEEARAQSLLFSEDLGDAEARLQPDPDFSPIGWHLGHVAWQEERWLHRKVWGRAPLEPAFDELFDSFRSPKGDRCKRLPPLNEIRAYAAQVREHTLRLAGEGGASELLRDGWVFRFLAEHELQHAETIAIVRLLARLPLRNVSEPAPAPAGAEGWLEFPAGTFEMGSPAPLIWDNEGPPHRVELSAFRISRRPVTNREWLGFMRAGGYERREWWSTEGWAFVRERRIEAPLHWELRTEPLRCFSLRGWVPLHPDQPVAHVSWYEAEAYARYAGARLPTEAEWECAARSVGKVRGKSRVVETAPADVGFLGKVWEWTASPFAPYPNFRIGPYQGYSRPWFGEGHRVLRGGSDLTHPEVARPTFRNWLEPRIRAYPAGLRLAQSA